MLAAGLASMSSAQATVAWMENWNPSNYTTGANIVDGAVGDVTDRSGWLNVTYTPFTSATENGWTFGGSALLVTNITTGSPYNGQGALYLNECCGVGAGGGPTGGATASTSISGLTSGKHYDMSVTFWGDNRPNALFPGYYDLFVNLGGSILGSDVTGGTTYTYQESDRNPGSSSPYVVEIGFTATGPTEALNLAQFSSGNSQQSPIVGPITVSVPEPSTWAMMALGFAGLGFAGYRRTRKAALAFG
jgi:PEP-CTERM motif